MWHLFDKLRTNQPRFDTSIALPFVTPHKSPRKYKYLSMQDQTNYIRYVVTFASARL